jgi:hypothetical protein
LFCVRLNVPLRAQAQRPSAFQPRVYCAWQLLEPGGASNCGLPKLERAAVPQWFPLYSRRELLFFDLWSLHRCGNIRDPTSM